MGLLTGISLFSGAGGLDLAAKWAGIRTVCYVENNTYAQGVLMSRMRDKLLDPGPIWDDVQTFDGTPWRGNVDCIFGGFPCQDLSVAGKQAGIEAGARSGLWKEFARIIREVGPGFVLVENVPGLLLHGQIGIVLGDLAEMGFDAEWSVLSAATVGAHHLRERVWIVANAKLRWMEIGRRTIFARKDSSDRRRIQSIEPQGGREQKKKPLDNSKRVRELQPERSEQDERRWSCDSSWWDVEPNVGRVAHGVAFRVDRIRCCGNGVVPQQAKPFFERIVQMNAIAAP